MKDKEEVEMTNDLNERPTNQCRCCDNFESKENEISTGIYKCSICGAIYGMCYLGQSYEFVLPYMTEDDVPPEETSYYDFTCIGSKGVTRRHGWYQPSTRLIVQVG